MSRVKIVTAKANLKVSERGGSPASTVLGGITVWATSEVILHGQLSQIRTVVESCAKQHLTATKSVLRKLSAERLGEEIEDRLFSAVLGWSLRVGVLDTVVCGSKNDRTFRAVVHTDRRADFLRAVETANRMFLETPLLSVAQLEKALFGDRRYNTWSSAMHVLATLSYLGVVEFTDERNVRLVELVAA